ncbi:unnamed protein product [Soboliphyme baturini]|uniref:MOB kinase activator-like 1 n=1 Tax=Soboliphyme baturini TaxID=241478 RepID=A0A183IVA6_9BILA|nr:unnamed protein product [Soboliphyme baturini]
MNFPALSASSRVRKTRKHAAEGLKEYELSKKATATIGSGNLRKAVMLPEGEDYNEWLAANIVDLFNQICMLYGTIAEFCTPEKCSVMSAGSKYEYYWTDANKKPMKCSAPQYVDYLLSSVQVQLDDESLFPSKIGVPFPSNFLQVAQTIMKRLFRIYAHIYYQHFDDVERLKEEPHFNTSFKFFTLFVQEFNLIEHRDLQPLQDIIDKLVC